MDKALITNLDIDITQNCTMSCVECTKLVPAFKGTRQEEVSPEVLYKDLSNLSRAATFMWGQLLGGEPTLHRNLLECIKAVRESKVSEKVIITTNGTLLNRITDEIIDSIDMVRISVYPGKIPVEEIDIFEKRINNRGKKLDRWFQNKFIPVYTKEPIKNIDLKVCIERNFEYKDGWMGKCYTYTDGYLCSCPTAFAINKMTKNFNVDGIFIKDDFNPQEMKEIILEESKKEYVACRNCLRCTKIESVVWRECSKQEWERNHL